MDATEEDREGYIISRMVNDFTENAAELAGKYGAFSTVEVYTALSVLLCRLAVLALVTIRIPRSRPSRRLVTANKSFTSGCMSALVVVRAN